MTTSDLDTDPCVIHVEVTDERLSVRLMDGRTISVPLEWYPRLVHGSAEERLRYELGAGGHGIHWPDLDEDISIENLLAGRRSSESERSLEKWLHRREANAKRP
jgi:hypothetical protein